MKMPYSIIERDEFYIRRVMTLHRFWCHFGECGFKELTSDLRPGPQNPSLFQLRNHFEYLDQD